MTFDHLEHFVLDTETLLALGGNKQVSGLIHIASGDQYMRLWVPVVSMLEAERERPGIVEYVGILDVLHPIAADYEAAHTLAEMHRRQIPFGVAAAVHAARPDAEFPEGKLVTTVAPTAYEGLGVRVIDLNR
ncbi:hypothetical protein ACIHCQ_22495 [Streptomyces sp. NPDC052236]|uniref:hypothetical protein n=1 Tax=Streptomyces sp. NPDC052236 TaxID=3365686 RepID=UPI0037CF6DC3